MAINVRSGKWAAFNRGPYDTRTVEPMETISQKYSRSGNTKGTGFQLADLLLASILFWLPKRIVNSLAGIPARLRLFFPVRSFMSAAIPGPLFLIGLFSMVAIGCSQSARPGPPVARDGVLDLRQWDFESNGSANLSGDWKLVWGQFASPNSPLRNAYDARVPRSWDHLGIEGVSGRGFGTLQLVLQGLPETTSGLTISLPSMTGAYRLYCGDSLIAATGTAGNSYETTTPERIPRVAILPTECIKENQAVLTWHVANFRHRTGGGAAELTSTMTIGLPAQTMSSVYRRHLSDLSLLAIAFIMALYHLVYWLFRRDDVQLVLFSAVAALFCVRITGTQTLLQQAFPSADF